MPRSSRQKLKLLYLRDYLLRYSDEDHPVTMKDMTAHLAANGISAERKSLYDDIEALRSYGMDIVQDRGNYCVGSRYFELPELKLLVDSVQSSKFITHRKTDSLIAKIEGLAGIYDAQKLNRQVFVTNRIKSMNESIYYNVDEIHSGIAANRRIRFRYFEYNTKKQRVFRHGGAYYEVSPYALTWDDENYYMVAFDETAGKIKHYRVDKMTGISVTELERAGQEAFSSIDMGLYAKKVFGMFSGDEVEVKLRVADHLVGAMFDRFGKDIMIVPDGDGCFTTQVNVITSPRFFGWVAGFGPEVVIVGPPEVAERMAAQIRAINAQYHDV